MIYSVVVQFGGCITRFSFSFSLLYDLCFKFFVLLAAFIYKIH